MHSGIGQPHAPFPLLGGRAPPVGALPPKGDVTPSKALKISTVDGKDIDLRGPPNASAAGAPIPTPAPNPAPPAVAPGTLKFPLKLFFDCLNPLSVSFYNNHLFPFILFMTAY